VRGTKKNPVEGEHRLYGFLTTNANATVKPIHSKAMPVILTGEACDAWLSVRRKDVPEPVVAKHQGRVFKVTGDGALVEFASAVQCRAMRGRVAAGHGRRQ
jgi:putative SOS response-associated peptidase YedK